MATQPPGPLDFYEPPTSGSAPPAPAEKPAAEGFLGNLTTAFENQRLVARPDRADAEDLRLNREYGPLLDALGVGASQNPVNFSDGWNRMGPSLRHSQLAEGRLVSRAEQVDLIAAAIARRQAADPEFLKGVPGTTAGLRQWVLDREKARQAKAAAVVARTEGLGGTIGSLAAGMFEMTIDTPNLVALPFGGGGKTIAQTVIREALVGAGVELAQQPIVAQNRAELGQEFTLGEAAANVALAGAGSGLLSGAVHGGVKGVQAVRERLKGRMTPDVDAALKVAEREAEVDEASPFERAPGGDETHGKRLASALQRLIDDVPAPPAVSRGTSTEIMPGRTDALGGSPGPTVASIARGEGAVAQFMAHIDRAEGFAKNPRSSASHRFQFVNRTWLTYYKKRFGSDGLSDAQIVAKRSNPSLQTQLMADLTADNRAMLERFGEAVTAGNLYLAHFLGPKAMRLLKADPERAVASLLPAEFIASNPEALAGKSASQVIAWAHRKMGGKAASVPVGGGKVADAGFDAAIMRDDALALQRQAVEFDGLAMSLDRYRPGEIGTDAALMQYKSGGDQFGVTDRLAGIDRWNPMMAGRIMVWEALDGTRIVADGHQRLGLARRIAAKDPSQDVVLDALTLREADGVSGADARSFAALKNIAEGTGSAVDAAKVLRDLGPDALAYLPPRSALVRDARALARLSDDAFGAVYNEVLPPDFAAVIGELLPNAPDAHGAMVDLLVKLDPANRGQAESLVRQGIAAGFAKETQDELFGAREMTHSLFLEKAKVLERGLARLKKLRGVFQVAAREADTLEGAGSTIARDQAAREAADNGQAIEILSRLAFRQGPVADALDRAARALGSGGRLADAVDQFVADVRGIDLPTALRGAGADAGDGLVPDGAGRGGDAFEEGQPLPAERGDQSEPELDTGDFGPGLFDEGAARAFDSGTGDGPTAQADSVAHDLAIDLADDDLTGFRLDAEGDERLASDIFDEIAADEAAADTLKGCL